MASFQVLAEAIHYKTPKVAVNDNKKIAAIKIGLNTRANTKEGSTFWDDFIRVCGDAESLAQLLGVSKYEVAKWPSEIHRYLKQVQEEIAGEDARKGKHNMINTGDQKDLSGEGNSPPSPPTQGNPAGANVMGGR